MYHVFWRLHWSYGWMYVICWKLCIVSICSATLVVGGYVSSHWQLFIRSYEDALCRWRFHHVGSVCSVPYNWRLCCITSLKAMPCRVKIEVFGSCVVTLAALYHIFCIISFGGCIDHLDICRQFLEALHRVNGGCATLVVGGCIISLAAL